MRPKQDVLLTMSLQMLAAYDTGGQPSLCAFCLQVGASPMLVNPPWAITALMRASARLQCHHAPSQVPPDSRLPPSCPTYNNLLSLYLSRISTAALDMQDDLLQACHRPTRSPCRCIPTLLLLWYMYFQVPQVGPGYQQSSQLKPPRAVMCAS